MLTTTDAWRAIAEAMPRLGTEAVELAEACGRILRQPVRAERDQPPFDRVTMDGIALRYDAVAAGRRKLTIEATQHAGDPVTTLVAADGCVEVMTGAVLPQGSDCVVPVERITVARGTAELEEGYLPERRQFVHARASDHAAGTELLAPGTPLAPPDIAIIASCGLTEVTVSRHPVIRIVSTGNELVPPGQAIEPHQVRLSNGPALEAMLAQQGYADCSQHHLPDDPAELSASLARFLEEAGVLILSGGVSMGQADFVPGVLRELGVDQVFHKISQRPGKPLWFGIGPAGQAVFGLPGNPVSSLVCCRQYVLPALLHAQQRLPRDPEWALLIEDVTFKPDLTAFVPARVVSDIDGILRARPVATNTSGDFTALHGTDGYVELQKEVSFFPRGTPVPLHRWLTP